ncbi:MAG TPA: HAMP domain-containing sensor histidine kinase, partial [Nitrolancea sp.]|nr:HAMP domain-containing sensor histidine kinase [Nitrolancea sp.]
GVALDLLLTPVHEAVSAPYALAVLVAAARMNSRKVVVVDLLATGAFLTSSYFDSTMLFSRSFGVLGLAITGLLAYMMAAQREKLQANARQERASHRLLQRFLSQISHDIAQPLTAIIGHADMLRRHAAETMDERDVHSVEAIEDAARRIHRLTIDLRDAGTAGTVRFEIQPSMMDLVSVIRQVVESEQASTSLQQIAVHAPERIVGEWDHDRIVQVLTNLVANAIKYSPHEGEVVVTARAGSDEALISVHDQGIGISRADIPLVFQAFYRADNARAVNGTGLGLYITQSIVQAHGGRIWLESEPGQGTTFFVALPLTTVAGAATETATSIAATGSQLP